MLQVYEDLRTGKMKPKDAVEVNNTAGKILNSLKVQLAYHAIRGEQPAIPFLEEGTTVIENQPTVPRFGRIEK